MPGTILVGAGNLMANQTDIVPAPKELQSSGN